MVSMSFYPETPFREHSLKPSILFLECARLRLWQMALGKRIDFKRNRMFLKTKEVSSNRPLLIVAADDTKAADDASHLRNAGSTFGVTKAQVSAQLP
jgi:hypothetical protein